MFNSKYVKVKKEVYADIEAMLEEKTQENENLKLEIEKMKQENLKLEQELEDAKQNIKYFEKDDLLFSYENENRDLRKENKELRNILTEVDEKLTITTSLESLYLETINKLQKKSELISLEEQYEEVGERLLDLYS